ncbi:MAG TPA: Lrp/AsnC family transcriptional regulator [Trebonia sp.]|jgi:DNA-binding Lrp family transcriptional regulator|nr:Lrp/AsnC family transcriptional regulator [Trebonia sp.]
MAPQNSEQAHPPGAAPKSVRAGSPAASLDETDRVILRELARDARLPNNTLAERAGVAPSTCLARVRSLRDRGVIRGYHAELDPAALGRPLQAMIAVRLQAGARAHLRGFVAGIARLPHVRNAFFLAGKDDFLLHVAATSTEDLRDFVERLSGNADVAYTETSLIFEHVRAEQHPL